MHISIPLFLAVFVLGFALGALLTALHRRSRIEKLKHDFQQQLESLVEREDSKASANTNVSEPDKVAANPTRAA